MKYNFRNGVMGAFASGAFAVFFLTVACGDGADKKGQALNITPDMSTDAALQAIIAGDHRTPAYAERDAYRRPYETLKFFGIERDMTVVEIGPGGGWYTEVLAPLLRDSGRLTAAGFDPDSEVEYYRKSAAKLRAKFDAAPEIYGKVQSSVFARDGSAAFAPDGSADMVLTFRNVHNWMGPDKDAQKVFESFYKALKPGGVLGLVEHRGDPAVPQDPEAKSGYVNEAYVIKLAEAAGFRLLEKSEINANPKDTRRHPEGVWTLPPALKLGDQDREKYLAIGESDRMTLKFQKPN
ncbi:MAG: methyltransferase domain-containing protein [bacterium]|nr:methyltransferase domain-containing protein [bacterium]